MERGIVLLKGPGTEGNMLEPFGSKTTTQLVQKARPVNVAGATQVKVGR